MLRLCSVLKSSMASSGPCRPNPTLGLIVLKGCNEDKRINSAYEVYALVRKRQNSQPNTSNRKKMVTSTRMNWYENCVFAISTWKSRQSMWKYPFHILHTWPCRSLIPETNEVSLMTTSAYCLESGSQL